MKLKSTFCDPIFKRIFASLSIKKTAATVLLFCCITYTIKAQTHEDSTLVLEKNAFSIAINHTPDGLLKLELVNNQASEITPFFIEAYIKGYVLNENHIEQSLNNILFTENIEHIFGPQFVGLGIGALPPFGNYKTTFTLADKINEASTLQIRISGSLNGQHVIWFGSFSF